MSDVVVVGGGIAGLAAALRLRDTLPAGSSVTVVEQSAAAGGKLRSSQVDGTAAEVDEGAETFLCRVPEAVDLARRLGLGDDLVHPATTAASVLVDGTARALPARTLLGVPADPDTAAGVLSPAGISAVRAERGLPPEPDASDWAVGELVGRRMGREIVDRLVDPLLGGVYAGHADQLSVRATLPPLAAALPSAGTLTAAAAAVLGPPPDGAPPPPVFAGLRGGVARLAGAAAEALVADGPGARGRLQLGRPVRELERVHAGWRLVVGSTRDPEPLYAGAVVLALPARPAGRLLAAAFPAASAEVGGIDYASMAIVTLVLPPVRLPAGSGLLVPAAEGRAVKAVTYASQKWPWLAESGATVVRASVGRYGEEAVLQRDDADLAALVRTELTALLGDLPAPRGIRVSRWGGALPQYAVGHVDRVRRAREALEATVALAGAAYDGVGIPACIRSGQAAADRVRAALAEPGESRHG